MKCMVVFSALVACISVSSVSADCIEAKIDFHGNDIKNVITESANDCACECRKLSGCKFFTWGDKGWGDKKCWLKTSDNGREHQEGRNSGTADCCKDHPGDELEPAGNLFPWNGCSKSRPCTAGQGDCDGDHECQAGLKCGQGNCKDFNARAHPLADCCSESYLYLSDSKVVHLPTFQEKSCTQDWPENKLDLAIAGLVTHNNSKEVMLCGGDKTRTGYGMTGCYIWTSHGWKQSDTTFNRRYAAASETSAGLLVTGGMDGSYKNYLSSTLLFTTTWQTFTELPRPTTFHCQVTVGNTVYIVGGWNPNSGTTGDTYKLTSSNQWSLVSSLNTPRSLHACVEWDGGILAIGGRGNGFIDVDRLSSVERYDVVSNKWFDFTPILPVKLEYHQAVVWGGDLYVLGGWDHTNGGNNKVVYKLKKGNQTWEVVPGVSVDLGTDYKRPIFRPIITDNIHCNN